MSELIKKAYENDYVHDLFIPPELYDYEFIDKVCDMEKNLCLERGF